MQAIDSSTATDDFKQERARIRLDQYFEFYYLHVIYFSTIGPFFYALFFWVRWVRSSLKNMLFIRLNPWCAFQNLYWSTCALAWIFALVLNNSGYRYSTFDAALLYSTLINTFIRSATVAGKYATYPRKEVRRIFSGVIETGTVRGEMMVDFWNRQDAQTVQTEISALDKMFDLGSMANEIVIGGSRMTVDEAMTLIVQAYNTENKPSSVQNWISLTLSVTRAIAIGLLNLAVGIRFHGDTTEEAILFYYVALFQFMYFSVGPMFFRLLLRDIRRQNYLTSKCIDILSSKPIDEIGGMPIDISSSSGTFKLLLKLSKYGDRFMQRHICLLSFTVLHAFFIELALVPFYFDVFSYVSSPQTQAKLQAIMVIDLGILTLASVSGLWLAAVHNRRKDAVFSKLEGMNIQADDPVAFKKIVGERLPLVGYPINWALTVAVSLVLLTGVAGGLYVVIAGKFKLTDFPK